MHNSPLGVCRSLARGPRRIGDFERGFDAIVIEKPKSFGGILTYFRGLISIGD